MNGIFKNFTNNSSTPTYTYKKKQTTNAQIGKSNYSSGSSTSAETTNPSIAAMAVGGSEEMTTNASIATVFSELISIGNLVIGPDQSGNRELDEDDDEGDNDDEYDDESWDEGDNTSLDDNLITQSFATNKSEIFSPQSYGGEFDSVLSQDSLISDPVSSPANNPVVENLPPLIKKRNIKEVFSQNQIATSELAGGSTHSRKNSNPPKKVNHLKFSSKTNREIVLGEYGYVCKIPIENCGKVAETESCFAKNEKEDEARSCLNSAIGTGNKKKWDRIYLVFYSDQTIGLCMDSNVKFV